MSPAHREQESMNRVGWGLVETIITVTTISDDDGDNDIGVMASLLINDAAKNSNATACHALSTF